MIRNYKLISVSELVLPNDNIQFSSVYNEIKLIDVNNIEPIVIDQENGIIDGKKRYLSFIYHGIDMIPVIVRTKTVKIQF